MIADANAPSPTRAAGPIQPRFTASPKRRTIPSRVTIPPAQASVRAPSRSLTLTSQLLEAGAGRGAGGTRGGGAGAAAGSGLGWGANHSSALGAAAGSAVGAVARSSRSPASTAVSRLSTRRNDPTATKASANGATSASNHHRRTRL